MKSTQKAILALEDGAIFEGLALGFLGEKTGEAVFNTSMTGYQEILTDPSYKGQIVIMSYPLIGNYGINQEDIESQGPKVEGFVVKENSSIFSNWRGDKSLSDYLSHQTQHHGCGRHGYPGDHRTDRAGDLAFKRLAAPGTAGDAEGLVPVGVVHGRKYTCEAFFIHDRADD